jgi:hypothetical protein
MAPGRVAITMTDRIPTLGPPVPFEATLERLRRGGWRVAIHNDYRLADRDMTFWLFTHPVTGRFIKGEAATDLGALRRCELEAARVAGEQAQQEPKR